MGWAEEGLGQGKELQVLVAAGTPGNGEDWEEYHQCGWRFPWETRILGQRSEAVNPSSRAQSPVGITVHRLPCQGYGYIVGIDSILCLVR